MEVLVLICVIVFFNLQIHFDMYLHICVISDDIKAKLFHVAIEQCFLTLAAH